MGEKLHPERCTSRLSKIRTDTANVQYQSQTSLVAVHKSVFAKAALAETEKTVGKNRRASYVYLRQETRYVLFCRCQERATST